MWRPGAERDGTLEEGVELQNKLQSKSTGGGEKASVGDKVSASLI